MTIEGRNLFQWRRAHIELVGHFLQYADHEPMCSNKLHKHDIPQRHIDERIVCDAAPCTCGLVKVLEPLEEPRKYTLPCPDANKPPLKIVTKDDVTVPPHTLWGIPVFRSSDVPPGRVRINNVDVEVTDADTGQPVKEGLRPLVYTGRPWDFQPTLTGNATTLGWCVYRDESECIKMHQEFGMDGCVAQRHHRPIEGYCYWKSKKDCQLRWAYTPGSPIDCGKSHHMPRTP